MEKIYLRILLISMILLIHAISSFAFDFKDIFRQKAPGTALQQVAKASRPISEDEEYYVGRAVAARILSAYPILEDVHLTWYVNLVGQTTAMHSAKPFTYGGYHFAILNTDEINAFACPGGVVFITRGMLNMLKNEEELAAVLAHEIAHVGERHGIAAIQSARWTEALTVIGATAAKQYGSADVQRLAGIFEGSVDDVFKAIVVNGYSQSQENSADESSLTYLGRAGYNPAALKDFLERLGQYVKVPDRGILKTHPATAERLRNINEKMPSKDIKTQLIALRSTRFNEVYSSSFPQKQTTTGQQTIPDDKARSSKAQQLRDEAYGLQKNNRVNEAIAKYRESLQYWPDAQLEQYIKQLEKTINANQER